MEEGEAVGKSKNRAHTIERLIFIEAHCMLVVCNLVTSNERTPPRFQFNQSKLFSAKQHTTG